MITRRRKLNRSFIDSIFLSNLALIEERREIDLSLPTQAKKFIGRSQLLTLIQKARVPPSPSSLDNRATPSSPSSGNSRLVDSKAVRALPIWRSLISRRLRRLPLISIRTCFPWHEISSHCTRKWLALTWRMLRPLCFLAPTNGNECPTHNCNFIIPFRRS